MEIQYTDNKPTILLISKSYDFFCYTKRMVCNQAEVCWCDFEQMDKIASKKIDAIVIDFDQSMVHNHFFRIIIKLKGYFIERIPILAIMEGENIQDIFEVLSLGALDYLDKSNLESEYGEKLSSLLHWRFYFMQKEKK